jgi:hypothetical protein
MAEITEHLASFMPVEMSLSGIDAEKVGEIASPACYGAEGCAVATGKAPREIAVLGANE